MRRSLPTTRLLALAVCVGGTLSGAATLAQTGTPAPAPSQPPAAKTAPPAATPSTVPTPGPATPAPAPKASEPSLDELLRPVKSLSSAIEAAEKNLAQTPGGRKELAALRNNIEKIENNAKEVAETLRPRLEEVRSQIGKLGDAPAENAPPEAPEVAAEREHLNGVAAQIDGAIKKAALIEVRARQLVSRVQHVRQGIFTRFLLSQTDTPLQPRVWAQAADQLHLARRQVGFIASNWWSVATLNTIGLLGVLGAALLSYVGLRLLTRRFIHARLDAAGPSTPSLPRRAATAAWVAPAIALPSAVAVAVAYIGLDELGLLYWQVERFAGSALYPIYVFIAINALARALLQPNRSRWRVFDLDDAGARTVSFAVRAIAFVFALDYLARRIISILSLPLSTSIVAAFIASLLYAALLLLIVCTPLTPPGAAPGVPVSRLRPYWLKGLLIALAVVLVGASALGYVALGRFITGQILTTGAGVLVVAVLYLAIQCFGEVTEHSSSVNRIIAQRLDLDDFGRSQISRVTRGILNILLFALAVPLLLLAWGMTGAEILSWVRAAVFGFDVGGMRISLARILMALVLFVGVLTATRFMQRWLAASALTKGRLDPGLANSIYTGAGYVGFAVAALVAISYAGFDITSLAIVAGALSVGIGFGLQSIVNNFISGLILLVERPIKVGDWIAIKDGEGYVRRIAVRSTEIETFDRASLIVPNSELISQTVTNLTHRNQLGRLKISVRVAYASDPDLAQHVLEQVAETSTAILRHPPPQVVLDKLGDQALEYSLRVYLADVNRSLQAQTELRTAIVKALREAGIDIPYFAVQVGHASGPRMLPDRVEVRIAAAHSSDPQDVQDALMAAAHRCAGSLKEPEPEVAFNNVGENGLEFSVSVAMEDGADAKRVETALRTLVVKTLRDRGIGIANPQRDVHLRDLEGLRTFLARLAEERAQRAGAEAKMQADRKPHGD